jgi:hypothetical protein
MTAFQTPENEAAFFARIEKLLHLAQHERTGEHEATAAAAMVQKLLQDRGLTLAHVEARGSTSDANQVARDKTQTDRRALYLWQQRLMAALACNNMCLHRIEQVWAMSRGKNRKSKQHMLIGRPLNIRVTLLAYDYLVAAIRRMATEDGFGHAEREADHHVFLDGAVERLKARLDEKREQREEEDARRKREAEATRAHPSAAPAEPGTALVLADVYSSEEDANNDVFQGWAVGTTAQARMRREQKDMEARAREVKRAEHEAELAAAGVPWPKCWYMSLGYDEDKAQALHDEHVKERAADAKRKARRQKEGTYQYRESAEDRRRWERENSSAYRAGRSAGDRVSLDEQIENARKSIK